MAGFPIGQLDRYLKILVQDLGLSVAVADQFERETDAINDPFKFNRRVARIVTPGTLIDEAFLNFQENNFLLSINFPSDAVNKVADPTTVIGLAWIDLSLGEFYVQETELKDLISDISRIRPSEILLDDELISANLESGKWFSDLIELKRYFIKYQKVSRRPIERYLEMFDEDQLTTEKSFQNLTQKETASSLSVLEYVRQHLPESEVIFELPERKMRDSIMQIDARTMDALELHKTVRENSKKGSLVNVIRRTSTQSGARLLTEWISAPSMDLKEIRRRQKMVMFLMKFPSLQLFTSKQLSKTSDMVRLLQRLSLSRGRATDLLQLARSLKMVEKIRSKLGEFVNESSAPKMLLRKLYKHLKSPIELADEILDCIDEDALLESQYQQEQILADIQSSNINEASSSNNPSISKANTKKERMKDPIDFWIMKPHASETLVKLHEELNLKEQEKKTLELYYKNIAPKGVRVELRWTPALGHVAHISGNGVATEFIKEINGQIVSKSQSTKWAYVGKWTEIGKERDSLRERLRNEERQVFLILQKKVLKKMSLIREVSHTLDYIDVTLSFAKLADEKQLVCPIVDNSTQLDIIDGRHVVVEEGLKKNAHSFVPNNCSVGKDGQLWLVSGPNMGGKSTFLRQNALITILAQVGCFVPAKYAKIGLVDKIFSRVGAADDLYRELSTFMVEMLETSFILKNATSKSLAIVDEIGRGTSGREGLAIAYSTLSYLVENNCTRTLFATHFGPELYKLISKDDILNKKVAYYCTDVISVGNPTISQSRNLDKSFIFSHKLRSGISKQSHGIVVAGMAGMPLGALKIAEDTLKDLEGS